MPKIGKKHFPYSKKGKKAFRAYAKKVRGENAETITIYDRFAKLIKELREDETGPSDADLDKIKREQDKRAKEKSAKYRAWLAKKNKTS